MDLHPTDFEMVFFMAFEMTVMGCIAVVVIGKIIEWFNRR